MKQNAKMGPQFFTFTWLGTRALPRASSQQQLARPDPGTSVARVHRRTGVAGASGGNKAARGKMALHGVCEEGE